MKKAVFILCCLAIMAACNNNKSEGSKIDTTPVLDPTSSNNYPSPVDTLGFHADSATNKYEKGSNLITNSDCLTCHKIKEKHIGPTYVAIAQKYPPTPENISYLTSKIIKGGQGVWGEVPMNAHPTLSEEDAAEMVNYILSLKDVE